MKENEVKVFSVIVDAEGNDKWISDGVFVDKPKLKTVVAPNAGNDRFISAVVKAIGLENNGVTIHRTEFNRVAPEVIEILIHYYPCLQSYEMRKKSIMIYG